MATMPTNITCLRCDLWVFWAETAAGAWDALEEHQRSDCLKLPTIHQMHLAHYHTRRFANIGGGRLIQETIKKQWQ